MTTNGELFNLKEHLDKPILIYFGYTYCPDICPATLVQVRQIVDQLGLNPEDYLLVMVTVDPERDTPEVLEKYLSRYEMSHVGLWGSAEELAPVLESYGVFAEKDPSDDPENYTMSHTARLFLIDKAGVLRTNYNFGTPEIEIQQDLEYILGE
jgi:protein SCO1/2